MSRTSGILCPVFSINGDYGIGQMGKHAFHFIDWLAEGGFSHWQILPLNPVDFVKSPYASPSAFAGYFALIDPEQLVEWGLLLKSELPLAEKEGNTHVNYQKVEMKMEELLNKAFLQFFSRAGKEMLSEYGLFLSRNLHWLNDYALFMALKEKNKGQMWGLWPEESRNYRNLSKEIIEEQSEKSAYHKFVQFLFFKQWMGIKKYAAKKGIRIIGDMPIYVSLDSVDVWSQPELFQLDEQLNPMAVAGVPPDFFAQDGQLWGFPLYAWEKHQQTDFKWWSQRTKHLFRMFDLLRFDHFRAIEAYWSVPADHPTARHGQWVKAPGKALLSALKKVKPSGLIAENLGDISEEVEALRKEFNIPGMAIFQFGFGGHPLSSHLPHFVENGDIYYSGTHDNEVISGWLETLSDEACQHLCKYYGVEKDQINVEFIVDRILSSQASIVILPLQDIMNLKKESRINVPGQVLETNWSWRFTHELLEETNPEKVNERLRFFGRIS